MVINSFGNDSCADLKAYTGSLRTAGPRAQRATPPKHRRSTDHPLYSGRVVSGKHEFVRNVGGTTRRKLIAKFRSGPEKWYGGRRWQGLERVGLWVTGKSGVIGKAGWVSIRSGWRKMTGGEPYIRGWVFVMAGVLLGSQKLNPHRFFGRPPGTNWPNGDYVN